MMMYLVGVGVFVLGVNLGILFALLLLCGKAQSLAEEYNLICTRFGRAPGESDFVS